MNPALSGLSVQQLRTLETLLRTRSVTRTAEALGQTQPAVSVTLRRLREALGDPLLVRSGHLLVPTPRGTALESRLRPLLGELHGLLDGPQEFDVKQSAREYAIATADCMQAFFLPRLVDVLSNDAPNLRIRLRPLNVQFDFVSALEEGALDAVIGNWPSPPLNLRRKVLFQDQMVCLARPGHPQIKGQAIDLETYLTLSHLAPEPYMANTPGPVDGALAQLGLKRNIKVTIPDFNLAGHVVAVSDLVFTCSRQFGDYYADLLGLQVVGAPEVLPPMRFYMLWHDRAHLDAGSRWLRERLGWVAKEFGEEVEQSA